MPFNIRQIIINDKKHISFVGKDVITLHDGMHIIFHDINNHLELIYSANGDTLGDGVECFIGHKSQYIFAFAEKAACPRIFLVTYPEFKFMAILKDPVECRYGAIELAESEHIISLTNFPTRNIIIWCWRTQRKLNSLQIDVQSTQNILRCGLTPGFFCHLWSNKLCVWEIAQMHKGCLLLQRPMHKDQSVFVDFTWATDGNLYAVDVNSDMYSITIDIVNISAKKQWSPDLNLSDPLITFYKCGLMVFGSKVSFLYLQKNKNWETCWKYDCEYSITNLISTYNSDFLICTTSEGSIVRLDNFNETMISTVILHHERDIMFANIINPEAEEIITLSSNNIICLWNVASVKMIRKYRTKENLFNIDTHSNKPLVAMCYGKNEKYGLCILEVKNMKIQYLTSKSLTDECINKVSWSDEPSKLLVFGVAGQLFLIKLNKTNLDVLFFINTEEKILDGFIFNVDNEKFVMTTIIHEQSMKNKCYQTSQVQEYLLNFEKKSCKIVAYLSEKNVFLGISDGNNCILICEAAVMSGIMDIRIISTIDMTNEIMGIFFIDPYDYVATWDNFAGIILEISTKNTETFNICDHFDEKIFYIKIDYKRELLIALTADHNLLIYVETKKLQDAKILYVNYSDNSKICIEEFQQLFDYTEMTWIEENKNEENLREAAQWEHIRNDVLNKYDDIQQKLEKLIDDNLTAPLSHRLPLLSFRLNTDDQDKVQRETIEKSQKEKIHIEKIIKAQDKVTEWIKATCWDPIEVVGTELHSIFTNKFIENYALLPKDEHEIENICKDILKSLELVEDNNLLKSWKNLFNERRLEATQPQNSLSMILFSLDENLQTQPVKVDNENNSECYDAYSNELSGSTTYQFIKPLKPTCSQMLLQSFMQMNWDALKTKETTRLLQLYFNQYFDGMMVLKRKELDVAKKRCNRLRYIISDLNVLRRLKGSGEIISLRLEEPEWVQEEIPIKLTQVEGSEINILPYHGPSTIISETDHNARVNPLYEIALINMMDGTLEKQWYEEVKKDIPKPVCMIEKDVEDLNETDIHEIEEWKEKMSVREKEREKYGNILYKEFFALSEIYNKDIREFNKKYSEMYALKLRVESVIAQEEFKHMLLRANCLNRIEAVEKLKELESNLLEIETEQEQVHIQIQIVQAELNECHTIHDNLMQKNLVLDKNFKINFADASKVVKGLCYKLFKKRPKYALKSSLTAGVLNELAQSCLTRERSPFLHHDCYDYLKSMDQLDSLVNMPPAMDEATWAMMCKLRRIKVENEVKICAVMNEINEMEMAYATLHKRQTALRNLHQKYKGDISNQRIFMERQTKNRMLQLVIKSGFVEIPTTGHLDDFQDAILIRQEDIEAINFQIGEAKDIKDKAAKATIRFKKWIVEKEWEHETLKMKTNQLQNEFSYFKRIKVTKEIQDYIHKKTVFAYDREKVEKTIQKNKIQFEKQLMGHIQYAEELEMKIISTHSQTQTIENVIKNLKEEIIRYNENELIDEEEKIKENMMRRLNVVAWRNKLISQIQKQRSLIVLLQTELELQRLKTYPTLSIYQQH